MSVGAGGGVCACDSHTIGKETGQRATPQRPRFAEGEAEPVGLCGGG